MASNDVPAVMFVDPVIVVVCDIVCVEYGELVLPTAAPERSLWEVEFRSVLGCMLLVSASSSLKEQ